MLFCHVRLEPWADATPQHLSYLDSLYQATTSTRVPVRSDGQVSLEPYREAGAKILEKMIDSSRIGSAVISKTSVDEMYVDMTDLVVSGDDGRLNARALILQCCGGGYGTV